MKCYCCKQKFRKILRPMLINFRKLFILWNLEHDSTVDSVYGGSEHLLKRKSAVLLWTEKRSSLVVRASDCQCTSCNGPGFDPSIRRHSGIWGAADEAVLNIVRRKEGLSLYTGGLASTRWTKQRIGGKSQAPSWGENLSDYRFKYSMRIHNRDT